MALPDGVVVSKPCWCKKQVDLERVHLGQEADQIFQRTAQPIDAPRHNDVELAPRCGPA
jgi:hypothetical protein